MRQGMIDKVAVAVQRQSVLYTETIEFALPALGSAHFHVSWLSDFIFYQKPLYKSLIIWRAELSSSHHAMRYCYHSVSIARSRL
jgi:hypothetical protein